MDGGGHRGQERPLLCPSDQRRQERCEGMDRSRQGDEEVGFAVGVVAEFPFGRGSIMFRLLFLFLVLIAVGAVLFTPATGMAQTDGIKLGKPFEGVAKIKKLAYLSANSDKIVLPTGGGFLRPRIEIDGKGAELSTIYVAEV